MALNGSQNRDRDPPTSQPEFLAATPSTQALDCPALNGDFGAVCDAVLAANSGSGGTNNYLPEWDTFVFFKWAGSKFRGY